MSTGVVCTRYCLAFLWPFLFCLAVSATEGCRQHNHGTRFYLRGHGQDLHHVAPRGVLQRRSTDAPSRQEKHVEGEERGGGKRLLS